MVDSEATVDDRLVSSVPPSYGSEKSLEMNTMSNPLASEISTYMQDTAGRLREFNHHRLFGCCPDFLRQDTLDIHPLGRSTTAC